MASIRFFEIQTEVWQLRIWPRKTRKKHHLFSKHAGNLRANTAKNPCATLFFFCELHFVPFGQADRDLAKMQFRLEIDTATATQEWAECKFACWHICQLPDATWRYLTTFELVCTCHGASMPPASGARNQLTFHNTVVREAGYSENQGQEKVVFQSIMNRDFKDFKTIIKRFSMTKYKVRLSDATDFKRVKLASLAKQGQIVWDSWRSLGTNFLWQN